ncbi:peptide alpha-N-acetyltransferase [Aureococcus anophagefferens]|nr:peptide alpha-N-acetyltransferase [Aureococcus anophagefferens]
MRVEDLEPIKALHEEWFPVRYSAAFYDAAVRERMLTDAATCGDELFEPARDFRAEECSRVMLLRRCVLRAEAEAGCGAVYLHVITYNDAAIEFYERNDFSRLRRSRTTTASTAPPAPVRALFLSRARAGDVRLDDDDGGDVASYRRASRARSSCPRPGAPASARGEGGAGRA